MAESRPWERPWTTGGPGRRMVPDGTGAPGTGGVTTKRFPSAGAEVEGGRGGRKAAAGGGEAEEVEAVAGGAEGVEGEAEDAGGRAAP